MKIVDAFWEKRNLGCDVIEVNIENFDNINDINNGIEKIKSNYVVVKAPTKRQDVYKFLSAKLFNFVEMLIDVSFDLEKNINEIKAESFISKKYTSLCDDVNKVLSMIKSGEIFKTDRIALDPEFSYKVAGLRYYNWISDLISDGGGYIVVNYINDCIVSFSVLKNTNNIFDCILWGLMPEYIGKGFGVSLIKNTIDFAKNNFGNKLVTTVSSNNLPIINCINKFNYKVDDEKYVFVRHK